MNLAKMIKTLQTEMFKTRTDNELESFLNVIMDHLCRDDFDNQALCLDPYRKDYIYDSPNHPWHINTLTYEQREYAQKQAINNLKLVCKKLKKFGFDCEIKVHKTLKNDGCGGITFYDPLLIIKL